MLVVAIIRLAHSRNGILRKRIGSAVETSCEMSVATSMQRCARSLL